MTNEQFNCISLDCRIPEWLAWLGSCGFIDWAQTSSGLGESEKRR